MVNRRGDGTIDWDWSTPSCCFPLPALRHVRLAEPLLVLMNGKKNEGLI